jgi:light-regulated signal transduction histidine kinase (bacteriophytochrome)/CheY-like chemotaxis protein
MSSPEPRPGEPVDLTNCDREPIHVPGSIQPHGCLLACDAEATVVERHSANAADMLGAIGPLTGASLDAVAGPQGAHAIRNALAAVSSAGRPALLFGLALAGGRFDVAVHRHLERVIVEFEPAGNDGPEPLELARLLIGRLGDIDDVDRLCDEAVRLARGLLSYDRVMIYRFEEDGAGKVVSEAKRADLERFLGQYFPASDIPRQARALYRRNTIRIIPDIDGVPVPLVPEAAEAEAPLDLSLAHLRAVSPIHCEYLRNMGVSASMSVSIIVRGELWGLIACHHYDGKTLPMAQRVAAEMFGAFLSLHLHALLQQRKLDTASHARRALGRLLHLAPQRVDVAALIAEHLGDLGRLLPCDGVGLWLNGGWTACGSVPPGAAIPVLVRLSGRLSEGRVVATHALSRMLPEAEAYVDRAAGVLAVPLSQTPRDYLFFFRKELVRTLEWGGNPDKSYSTGPHGDRLTPRKSFAIWRETVRLQSQPWTELDRDIGEAVRAMLAEVVLRHNELMAEEREKADVRQRMLNEELNHRVKNILAVIKSVVGHPVEAGRSLAAYVSALQGRIQALAVAHDQVVRGDGGGLFLELLEAELSPYRSAVTTITLDGPPVWLDARAFSVLALVLHELSTNAAKYGALSVSGGRLDVTWRFDESGGCAVTWRERGGPTVAPPTREGFGSALIERSIPYDLGGTAGISYGPEGVEARLTVPAKHLSDAGQLAGLKQGRSPVPAEAERASFEAGKRVLLVEDQLLIAMDVEQMLAAAGLPQVVTAASVPEALRRIADSAPDVAVLDVNLGVTTSIPVAEELTRRGVPFVFATGYGDSTMIPATFAAVPVVRKPYGAPALTAAIAKALGGGG